MNFIDKYLNYSLSNEDITKFFNKYKIPVKIIKYSEIDNYKNIEKLFDKTNNIIILFETAKNTGHWCILKRIKDNIIYSSGDTILGAVHSHRGAPQGWDFCSRRLWAGRQRRTGWAPDRAAPLLAGEGRGYRNDVDGTTWVIE